MFEILTLVQTPSWRKDHGLIYGKIWKKVFSLEALVDTGAASPQGYGSPEFADTPEQAFESCAKA